MAHHVARRDDVNPEEGIREYGHVKFADETNHKYPIDTPDHVRAAWSYINHPNDAAKYSPGDVKIIKDHIKQAAKKVGVDIESS